MKLLFILPLLAVIFVAGCVGQTATLGNKTVEPGVETPASAPLPPPSSAGIGFVLVSPQPGQHIFTDKVSVVAAPVNFTLVAPGGEVKGKEGHFHIFLDDRAYIVTADKSYVYENVAIGNHTLKVEVHANDHAALSPPLARILYFTTGPAAPPAPAGCKYNNPHCPADYSCEDNVCVPRGSPAGG